MVMNQRSTREESKSCNLNKVLMLPADQIGIWASGLLQIETAKTRCVLSSEGRKCAETAERERTTGVSKQWTMSAGLLIGIR